MTIYTATFRTADTWATQDIDATTPEAALQQARALADTNAGALDWCTYDPSSVPLEEIEISGPEGIGLAWQSEELALRLAADDLLDACETAVERLMLNDEAGEEQPFITKLQAAIAKAKGGAS